MTDSSSAVIGGEFARASAVLRLARLLPIIEASGASFCRELRFVISDWSDIASAHAVVQLLERERLKLSGSVDVMLPGYYQVRAIGIALFIASSEDEVSAKEFNRIGFLVENFWSACDSMLHESGAFSKEPILKSFKTTLSGVENIWFERDMLLLSSEGNLQAAVDARLAEIGAKSPTRNEIAGLVARSAGWVLSTYPRPVK